MKANTPWSGFYEVWPSIWAMAHTAQFAQPGWQYLDAACRLEHGGSCVALRDPKAGGDYSIIIETADAKAPQTVSFRVAGGLAARAAPRLAQQRRSQFSQQADIAPWAARLPCVWNRARFIR